MFSNSVFSFQTIILEIESLYYPYQKGKLSSPTDKTTLVNSDFEPILFCFRFDLHCQ